MTEQEKNIQPNSINAAHENDAKKIINKHLADSNHVITDEELASVRVEVSGAANEPIQSGKRKPRPYCRQRIER